ncbi:MAG: ATP-binding protein [Candidatus Omnitrophota bacterium]|nr:ATP-binding protein [Candidatus Omnitrophota bacterium]
MFSEPVVGERFFGREEVLELLNRRVSALKDGYRQNVALTGPSLAGKSSIILHFLRTVKEEGFIPIYVEVVKEDFESFANKFIATLLYNSLQRLGEESDVDMETLLDKAIKALPNTAHAIKQVNASMDRGDHDEAYLGLLGLTSVLKGETGFSCVVILDEFDNLEALGIKNPFLGFGKVIMVQKDTMYIVSSSRNDAIKKIISEKLALLFGNFEVVNIRNFDLATSRQFLDIRFSGFEIADSLKKFFIAFTDGNPFYLDRLSARAKELSTERLSGHLDKNSVADVILELVYNANGLIHQYLLNYLLSLLDTRSRDSCMSILVSIANGRNKRPDIARGLKAKQAEVSKGLLGLSELGLVSKNGVFYKIEDAMLTFWLKHVYQRRRQLLVDGTFDKTELFGREIMSYISAFEEDCEKSSSARLAELFNAFSNELVSIESKNIRLPHFTKVEIKSAADSREIIAASFRGNFWIAQAFECYLKENDVISYIKNTKVIVEKISNKIIVPLRGIDENAKLLAKELKISIWDVSTVNGLLGYYNKKNMVVL